MHSSLSNCVPCTESKYNFYLCFIQRKRHKSYKYTVYMGNIATGWTIKSQQLKFPFFLVKVSDVQHRMIQQLIAVVPFSQPEQKHCVAPDLRGNHALRGQE